MSDNVIPFYTASSAGLTPDEIFEAAKTWYGDTFIIIGYDTEGGMGISASGVSDPEALWLLMQAQRALLEGDMSDG